MQKGGHVKSRVADADLAVRHRRLVLLRQPLPHVLQPAEHLAVRVFELLLDVSIALGHALRGLGGAQGADARHQRVVADALRQVVIPRLRHLLHTLPLCRYMLALTARVLALTASFTLRQEIGSPDPEMGPPCAPK